MMLRNMSVSSLGVFMVVYLVDIRGYELTLATARWPCMNWRVSAALWPAVR